LHTAAEVVAVPTPVVTWQLRDPEPLTGTLTATISYASPTPQLSLGPASHVQLAKAPLVPGRPLTVIKSISLDSLRDRQCR
jgi:hypothetical protein